MIVRILAAAMIVMIYIVAMVYNICSTYDTIFTLGTTVMVVSYDN